MDIIIEHIIIYIEYFNDYYLNKINTLGNIYVSRIMQHHRVSC